MPHSAAVPGRPAFGVLGVGSIASAIVTGLARPEGPPRGFVLSPRSAQRAARLAAAHSGVRVATDNQEAVTDADVVLLCLRAADAPEVLKGLTFTPRQRVISVMPSLSVAELRDMVGPVAEISRAIPAVSVAERAGLTPVYPAGSAADATFAELGSTVPLGTEAQLEAASAASATVAAHFAYLTTIVEWLVGRGVDAGQARRLVGAVFTGAAADLATASAFDELAGQHATPGGQNEQLLAGLRRAGVYEAVGQGLDDLLG